MKKDNTMTKKPKHRSMMAEASVRLLHNRTAMFGMIIFLLIVVLCLLAEVICPEGYDA